MTDPILDDIPLETPVSRFIRDQLASIGQASGSAGTAAMQDAVYGALLDDFGHQLAGALGALLGYYRDPEAALGALVTTMVDAMQAQRTVGRPHG